MSDSKYGSMTIIDLKNELRKRNARITGRKQELVDRLEAYDRNFNFGKVDYTDPEFCMQLPSYDTYADVNSDTSFSGLSMDTVHSYFGRFEKKFENHFIHLYDDNFLTYYRVSINTACTFIKGNCRAEMRKGVCYTIDIKLSNEGSVLEAQCECAAGMGPDTHCKHVAAVMYGAVMFAKNKFIKTEETCTQRLQTFHKSKRFKGSPIKSDDLNLPGADELTNIAVDPRPEEFRNNPSYPHYFRNVCLNFSGISKMPIYQTFTPANMIAVANDHDYLTLSPEDNFLEKLQITKISYLQVSNKRAESKQNMEGGESKTFNIFDIW
ncbi:uncharacterized protein LOC134259918 [Saccostrea cucullata]|uniref:uncharacterized protein LOC134259918 n=1 Tax=Saccostrea cuccullata TaxID=36930 RepID=UPI002ED3AA24